MSRERILRLCAWGVHSYTALGSIAGLLAIQRTADGDFRAAFILMGIATAIDSSDGPLARAVRVRQRTPMLDGALLDNIVDYLTYVIAPAFLMLRDGTLGSGTVGLAAASFVCFASAYGFCRVDAKTEDHYFRGFPSYWNLVALYLFCLRLRLAANIAIVTGLGVLVFVPLKFIYPNRTELMRPLTLTLAAIWAIATAGLIASMPAENPLLLYTSLAFVVYYFVMSIVLHAHPARVAADSRRRRVR